MLAIARSDLRITLVEPLERRTTFLEEVVAELALPVEVVRGRAEALHGVRVFDVVTSRALAPLDRLLAWSMPLVAPDGVLLAMKGRSLEEEIRAAEATLRDAAVRPARGARARRGNGVVHHQGGPGGSRGSVAGSVARGWIVEAEAERVTEQTPGEATPELSTGPHAGAGACLSTGGREFSTAR